MVRSLLKFRSERIDGDGRLDRLGHQVVVKVVD